LAARHRPPVIRFEQRPQQRRQRAQQRLLRADAPVVVDVDEPSVLTERPDAAALEVAVRRDREPVGIARFDHREFPAQRVRQPPFRVHAHAAADAARIRRTQLLRGQVHRRPPPRQRERVAEHVRDLAARGFHAPMRDELIFVRRPHPALPACPPRAASRYAYGLIPRPTNAFIRRRRSSFATLPWLSGSVLNFARTVATPSASDSTPRMSMGASTTDPHAASCCIAPPTSRIVPMTRSMFSVYATFTSTIANANCLLRFASAVIVPFGKTCTAPSP